MHWAAFNEILVFGKFDLSSLKEVFLKRAHDNKELSGENSKLWPVKSNPLYGTQKPQKEHSKGQVQGSK